MRSRFGEKYCSDCLFFWITNKFVRNEGNLSPNKDTISEGWINKRIIKHDKNIALSGTLYHCYFNNIREYTT